MKPVISILYCIWGSFHVLYSADGGRRRVLCVFGGFYVDMWRLVHQWSFFAVCFWLFLTIGTLLVQSKQQKRPLVYQSLQVYQDCTNSVPVVKNCQQTVKTAKKWPLVYQSSQVYQNCTNSVKQCTSRQKQSKDSQNSKNDHWCTNSHRSTKTVPTVYQSLKTVKQQNMTIGVPIVTCLHRVRRIHKVRVRRPHHLQYRQAVQYLERFWRNSVSLRDSNKKPS